MSNLFDKGGYYCADNAVIVGDVKIHEETSIWYGVVIRADIARIHIGKWTNIQDLSVLHCDPDKDLVVGDYVTIGHHANVHACSIGDESLIGIGAILLGGVEIGKGCVIAAGAVVKENEKIPDRSLVVGVPARIIGTVSDDQIEDNIRRAKLYNELAKKHLK